MRPELDILDPEFLMYSKLLTGGQEWQLVAVAYVVAQGHFPALEARAPTRTER